MAAESSSEESVKLYFQWEALIAGSLEFRLTRGALHTNLHGARALHGGFGLHTVSKFWVEAFQKSCNRLCLSGLQALATLVRQVNP